MMVTIIAGIVQLALLYWVLAKIARIDRENYFTDNHKRLTLPKYVLVFGLAGTAFFGFAAFMVMITPTSVNKTATWQIALLFAAFTACCLYHIWAYAVCRHRYDDTGLSYTTVLNQKKFLPWDDIAEIGYSRLLRSGILISKRGEKFYISDSSIGLNDFMQMLDAKFPEPPE